jgi:hypothetical protein
MAEGMAGPFRDEGRGGISKIGGARSRMRQESMRPGRQLRELRWPAGRDMRRFMILPTTGRPNFKKPQFAYVSGCGLSPQGVLFLLKNILKENTTFGGWRWEYGRRRIGVGEAVVTYHFPAIT